MPLSSLKNQYRGVNPHLMSALQTWGNFPAFHTYYLVSLAQLLQADLRGRGFRVELEESLQLRRASDDVGSRPRADIAIHRTPAYSPMPNAGALQLLEPTATIEHLLNLKDDPISEDSYFSALALYKRAAAQPTLCAWIELLSPSNKRGEGRRVYQQKRNLILAQGIVFVEIDFLHQTPSTYDRLPHYVPPFPQGVHPYMISIADPREDPLYGPVWAAGFDVDAAIPPMVVPLTETDAVRAPFDQAYRALFETYFQGDTIDYRQLPAAFETYSPDDQTRIVRRMLAVKHAAERGASLEETSDEVSEIALAPGLLLLGDV